MSTNPYAWFYDGQKMQRRANLMKEYFNTQARLLQPIQLKMTDITYFHSCYFMSDTTVNACIQYWYKDIEIAEETILHVVTKVSPFEVVDEWLSLSSPFISKMLGIEMLTTFMLLCNFNIDDLIPWVEKKSTISKHH